MFHPAIIASSDNNLTGSTLGLLGILLVFKYLRNSSSIIYCLYYLLKGPAYEINEEAINTSPVKSPRSSEILTTLAAQRSFSDPKALTSL